MNHDIVNEINDFFIKFKSNCNGEQYPGLSMVSELVIDIESDQLNTIFRRYKRVKDTYKTSGLGLGFILLQKLSKDAKVKFGWKAHFIKDLFFIFLYHYKMYNPWENMCWSAMMMQTQ